MANICKKYVFWMSEKIKGFSRRWVLWRILKIFELIFFLVTVSSSRLFHFYETALPTILSPLPAKLNNQATANTFEPANRYQTSTVPSTVEPWKLFKRFSAFPLSHSAMFVGGCHFASVHQTLCSVVWKEWLFLRHRSAPTRGHHCGHRNRFAWLKVVIFV